MLAVATIGLLIRLRLLSLVLVQVPALMVAIIISTIGWCPAPNIVVHNLVICCDRRCWRLDRSLHVKSLLQSM